MHLTKMQGLGNSYLFLNCLREGEWDYPGLARRWSDRHFGIGSDGLICVLPSGTADFQMRIFNADGSEGEMCGNGIRCFGKYLWDHGLTERESLKIETRAGIRTVCLQRENGRVNGACVQMGTPKVGAPMTLSAGGENLCVTPVSVGNPHAVLLCTTPEQAAVKTLGPLLEHHSAFPHGTNVEFVSVKDRTHLTMRVRERGSGETMACGTGACAAFAAAFAAGQCEEETEVTMPGGALQLRREGGTGTLWMTGPTETIAECDVEEGGGVAHDED